MAGDLVKTVFVKIKVDGAQQAKDDLNDIALRAGAISKMDMTIKPTIMDRKLMGELAALRLEFRALKDAGVADFAAIANRAKEIGDAASTAAVKLAALRLELATMRSVGTGDQGGGFFSRLLGGAFGSGLGGALGGSGAGAGAGIPVIGGALAALGPVGGGAVGLGILSTGILGIIPALASAGGAVASFGALAYGTFGRIIAVAGLTGDRFKDIPVGMRHAARGIQSLSGEFDTMAAKLRPVTLAICSPVFTIAQKVLPMMLPFAQVAGGAILKLLDGLSKFVSSPGFKSFADQMLKLSGPAILTIGQGIGRVAIAFGKLLEAFVNPNGIRMLRILFDVAEWAIQGIAAVFRWGTPIVIMTLKGIAAQTRELANLFDRAWHDIKNWTEDAWKFITRIWHDLVSQAKQTAQGLRGEFDTVIRYVEDWYKGIVRIGGDIITWFGGLPGKIISALSSLGGLLFKAGQHAVQSLISGLGSMLGSLGNMAATLAHKVAGFFGLSPAKEGPLSGRGAPEIRGAHFAEAFAAGMLGRSSAVAAAAHGVANAAAVGAAGGGYGPGGGDVVLHLNVSQQQLFQWMHTGLLTLKRDRGFTPNTSAGLGLG